MGGSYAEHQEILGRAFLKFAEAFPEGLIFSRHTGKFLNLRFVDALNAATPDLHRMMEVVRNHKRFLLSISMKGQSDSYIVLPLKFGGVTVAVHIEVEVKSGEAVQSPDQKNWQKAVEAVGGLYILVRHEEDIVNEILKKWPSNS